MSDRLGGRRLGVGCRGGRTVFFPSSPLALADLVLALSAGLECNCFGKPVYQWV